MIELLAGIKNTTAALNAERMRLDIIGENIANAQTTRGVDGKPYQRKVVVFEAALQQAMSDGDSSPNITARVQKDESPFQIVHMPGHRDADENGMVTMPNVNIHSEMVDLIAASRAYEANLAVVRNARTMAMQTLAIGKR
jgi:flagellar basal-body rod protein FlgC